MKVTIGCGINLLAPCPFLLESVRNESVAIPLPSRCQEISSATNMCVGVRVSAFLFSSPQPSHRPLLLLPLPFFHLAH